MCDACADGTGYHPTYVSTVWLPTVCCFGFGGSRHLPGRYSGGSLLCLFIFHHEWSGRMIALLYQLILDMLEMNIAAGDLSAGCAADIPDIEF